MIPYSVDACFTISMEIDPQLILEVLNTFLDCVQILRFWHVCYMYTVWKTSKLRGVGIHVCHGIVILLARCSIGKSCDIWKHENPPVIAFSFEHISNSNVSIKPIQVSKHVLF